MRASVISPGEKADRLEPAWIRSIKNRDSIAEHVADVKMPAVEHDLNAIRPAAEVAVRQMLKTLSDTLWMNRGLLRRSRLPGTRHQRRETQQTFHAIASSDCLHALAICRSSEGN